MATIASRPEVVEVKPQVPSIGDRNLVVGVKVPFATRKPEPKFLQDAIGGRSGQARFTA